jgi:hypothetical protein
MEKLVDALVRAQKKISDANRSALNEFFKKKNKPNGSPYATLEDVIQAVKEPLLEEGILFIQVSKIVEGGVSIETIFHGHGAELPTGPQFVPAKDLSPHGYGSALTYARRYSLSTACGIGSADDDGNQAEVDTAQNKKKDATPTPIKKKVEITNKDDELPF